MVLGKLKRLLGLDSGKDDAGRSERDVTVQDREDADAENEAAVKGTDEGGVQTGADDPATEADEVDESGDSTIEADEADEPIAADTDADASTESLVDEEIAQAEPSGRAEPAEAAGPDAEDETTDVEETGPEVEEEAAEAAEDSPPVDEIKGIGPAYSERLAEIGIETVADLRGGDAAEIAERTTAPEGTVQKWIDRADDWD